MFCIDCMLASVCNKLSSKPFHLGMGDGRLLSAHCTLSVYWQVFTTEQYFLNGVATVSSISAKLENLFVVVDHRSSVH